MAKKTIELKLTIEQARALQNALGDLAMQMDDDGRDGEFDATPLAAVYEHLNAVVNVADFG